MYIEKAFQFTTMNDIPSSMTFIQLVSTLPHTESARDDFPICKRALYGAGLSNISITNKPRAVKTTHSVNTLYAQSLQDKSNIHLNHERPTSTRGLSNTVYPAKKVKRAILTPLVALALAMITTSSSSVLHMNDAAWAISVPRTAFTQSHDHHQHRLQSIQVNDYQQVIEETAAGMERYTRGHGNPVHRDLQNHSSTNFQDKEAATGVNIHNVQKDDKIPYNIAAVSAFIAATVATLVSHPIDTIKTRIQAQMAAGKSSEGNEQFPPLWSNLYAGVFSNLFKEAPNAMVYIGVVELTVSLLDNYQLFQHHPIFMYFIAGMCGDAVGSVIRVPAELMNKRLQLGFSKNWFQAAKDCFLTPLGATNTVNSWAVIGLRDTFHGGIQIALYETLKMTLPSYPLAVALACVLPGMIGAMATTPMDVVVTQLSTQNPQSYLETKRYMCGPATFKRIVNERGPTALLSGILQRGLYYAPMSGVFFFLYEICAKAGTHPEQIIEAWHHFTAIHQQQIVQSLQKLADSFA